jgi:hypothetical protein
MGALGESARSGGVSEVASNRPAEDRGARAGLLAMLALFVAWSGWLVWRSSFLVEGRRIFCLFDDAMISMTYARNLLEGYGLNWARFGAPVEGFTHPLWLLVMLPANLPFIALPYRSLVVQAISLVVLSLAAGAAGRLVRTHFARPGAGFALPAAVLTAFYYPLAYWSLMGMETPLQALLLLVGVQLVLDASYAGRDRHGALWLACTAAYLLRMDMLIPVAVLQLYLLATGGVRKAGLKSWLVGAAGFVVAAGGYELFRWVYFHDLLPNTYYLKLGGVPLAVRLARGGATVALFAWKHWVLLAVAAVAAVALRRDRKLRLPLLLFAVAVAYTWWVGGDAWEEIGLKSDRFIAYAMPMLFVVLAAGVNAGIAAWRRRRPAVGRLLPPAVAAAATVVLLVLANGLAFEIDSEWNRGLMSGSEPPPLALRHAEVLGELARFERIVRPPAVVGTAWAGIPAFFSDYRMVDLLGYNDRHLAHLAPVRPLSAKRYWEAVPGHLKYDPRYELEQVRPDAFFQIWAVKTLGNIPEVMKSHGYRRIGRFWLRADSPFVAPPEDLGGAR